jgi:hypothetical protein
LNAVNDSLLRLCAKPSQENLEKFAAAGFDIDARTCSAWVYNFEQIFDYNAATGRWENVTGPEGSCGALTVSFFETDTGARPFWRYKTKKTITNKSTTLGIDCSKEVDEAEHTYDWTTSNLADSKLEGGPKSRIRGQRPSKNQIRHVSFPICLPAAHAPSRQIWYAVFSVRLAQWRSLDTC